MGYSLRVFVNVISFPGIIIHELSHKFYCDRTGTKVFKVRYLRIGNPMGYVIHATPDSLQAAFAISVGPLVINTLLCSLFPLAACFFELRPWIEAVMVWVGISAGFHAFPSNVDATSFRDQVRASRGRFSLIYLFSLMFVGIIWLANVSKYIWFDLLYAVVIAGAGPVYVGCLKIPDKIVSLFT